ncbi:MAG TPA: D-glycerate dehydrogenase [Rhodocyclaceae bacterium]
MKPRILVSRAVFPEVIDRLASVAEIDAHTEDAPLAPDELARRLQGKQGALTMISDRVDAAVLGDSPTLKAVCNVAVGYNNLDLDALTARGIAATNTPGVLDDTTADLAWALILASTRRVVSADKWVRAGQWDGWRFLDWLGDDVHHATLGIVGMGRIGSAVARRAAGFEMKVIYHNRRPLPASEASGAQWVTFPDLLATADVIVLMVPYSPATHHLIGEKELAQMKPSAHLINVARGGVVDDDALIAALSARHIAGAGLDVFENEPALDRRFCDLDNVVVTPHIGSASRGTRLAMAMRAADNLLQVLKGEKPRDLLNPAALAR